MDSAQGGRNPLIRRKFSPGETPVSPHARLKHSLSASQTVKRTTPDGAHTCLVSSAIPDCCVSVRPKQAKRVSLSQPTPGNLKRPRLLVKVLVRRAPSPEPRAHAHTPAVITVPVQVATAAASAPQPRTTDGAAPSCSPSIKHDSSSQEAQAGHKPAHIPVAPLANSATDIPSKLGRRCSSPESPTPLGAADSSCPPCVLPVPRAGAGSQRSAHVDTTNAPVAMGAAGRDSLPDSAEAAAALPACRTPLADVACVNSAVPPCSSGGSHGKMAAAGHASTAAPHCSEPSSGSAVTHASQTLQHSKECNSTTEAACMCAMNEVLPTSAAAVRGGSGAGGDGASSECADATPTAAPDTTDAGASPDVGAPDARGPVTAGSTQAGAEGLEAARASGDNRDSGASAAGDAADGVGGANRHAASTPAQQAEVLDAYGGSGRAAGTPEDTASALARQRRARYRALSKKRRPANAPGSHRTSTLVQVHSRWAQWRSCFRKKHGSHRMPTTLMPSSMPLMMLTKHVRQQMGGSHAEAAVAVQDALARAATAQAEEAARVARGSGLATAERQACASAGAAPPQVVAAAAPHAAGQATGEAAAGEPTVEAAADADVAACAIASAADTAAPPAHVATVEEGGEHCAAAAYDTPGLVDAVVGTGTPPPPATVEDAAAEPTEPAAADMMDVDGSDTAACTAAVNDGSVADAPLAPACSTEPALAHTATGEFRSGLPRMLLAFRAWILRFFSVPAAVLRSCRSVALRRVEGMPWQLQTCVFCPVVIVLL